MRSAAELITQWRADLDGPATASLCAALAEHAERASGALDATAAVAIGAEVETRFASDPTVQMAVGRLYMACGQLDRALRPLAIAARIAPGALSLVAHSLLGELLLRVGDARRSVEAFERALSVCPDDLDLQQWLSSAQSYVRLQDQHGTDVVAREIRRVAAGRAPGNTDDEPDSPTRPIEPTLVLTPAAPHRADEVAPEPVHRARRPLPTFTEALPGQLAAWSDDPTRVTSMTRLVATLGDLPSSDDDMPTAVRDPESIRSLIQSSGVDPRDQDAQHDGARNEPAAPVEPAQLVARETEPFAEASRQAPPDDPVERERTDAETSHDGGALSAAARTASLRANPALACVDVAIRSSPPIPATSDRILPLPRSEAPEPRSPSFSPTGSPPPLTLPPARRRSGAAVVFVGAALLVAAAGIAGLALGWLPDPIGRADPPAPETPRAGTDGSAAPTPPPSTAAASSSSPAASSTGAPTGGEALTPTSLPGPSDAAASPSPARSTSPTTPATATASMRPARAPKATAPSAAPTPSTPHGSSDPARGEAASPGGSELEAP